MHFNVIVIGGGFSGLHCAKGIAQAGLSVALLERKANVGDKVHSTGILVKEALAEINISKDLYKEIRKVYLFSPSLKKITLESDDYIFCATDTGRLMNSMAVETASAGVQFFYSTAYKNGVERDGKIFVNDGTFTCDYLVGADGPRSKVAQDFGLHQNKQFLLGAEIEVDYTSQMNPDGFYCFLNQKFAPGYLGWVVPGKPLVQLGLAGRLPFQPRLNEFIEHISPVIDFRGAPVRARRGGLIPVGGLGKNFYSQRVLLLGDASGVVSPLTAGGIHPALRYGSMAGGFITEYLKGESLAGASAGVRAGAVDRDFAANPGQRLAKVLPRFQFKHFLKNAFYHAAPDFALDLAISSRPFRSFAERMFFKEKNLR